MTFAAAKLTKHYSLKVVLSNVARFGLGCFGLGYFDQPFFRVGCFGQISFLIGYPYYLESVDTISQDHFKCEVYDEYLLCSTIYGMSKCSHPHTLRHNTTI